VETQVRIVMKLGESNITDIVGSALPCRLAVIVKCPPPAKNVGLSGRRYLGGEKSHQF